MGAQEMVHPALALDVNPGELPVHALAFNPKRPELIAVGDSECVQVRSTACTAQHRLYTLAAVLAHDAVSNLAS